MTKENILQHFRQHTLPFAIAIAITIAIFFSAIYLYHKNNAAANNQIDSIKTAENSQDRTKNHTSSKDSTDTSIASIEPNNISSVTTTKKENAPIIQSEIISPENGTHVQDSTEHPALSTETATKQFDNPWQSYSDQIPVDFGKLAHPTLIAAEVDAF